MNKNAFTLLELIIIIGIFVVVFGSSFAYFIHFQEKQKLVRETERLTDVLYLARKKAIAGDVYNKSCNKIAGYKVGNHGWNGLDGFNSKYYLIFSCSDDDYISTNLDELSPYYLPIKTILFTDGGVRTAFFLSPLGNADQEETFTLKNSYLNQCSQVHVEKTGLITSSYILCPL